MPKLVLIILKMLLQQTVQHFVSGWFGKHIQILNGKMSYGMIFGVVGRGGGRWVVRLKLKVSEPERVVFESVCIRKGVQHEYFLSSLLFLA